jgi:hypothetical protein
VIIASAGGPRLSVRLAGTGVELGGCVARRKRELTAQQRAEKKRRREEFMTIFVGGKQKRVKRPPTIDGMSVEEFTRRNADALWYHQNEMWDEIELDVDDE